MSDGDAPVEDVLYTRTRDGGDAAVIFAENGNVADEPADDALASGEPWLAMTGYEEVVLELELVASAAG